MDSLRNCWGSGSPYLSDFHQSPNLQYSPLLHFGYEWDFMRPADPKSRPDKTEPPAPKVLDADGAEIREGDTVWRTDTGREYWVAAGKEAKITPDAVTIRLKTNNDCGDEEVKPSQLTHRAPVLAADGRPLREGETVWGTKGGSYHLTSVHDGKVFARHVGGSFGAEVESAGGEGLYRLRADQLTHKRPDSFEQMEKDANDLAYDIGFYLGDYSPSDFKEPGDTIQDRIRDLMRRTKALAERDR